MNLTLRIHEMTEETSPEEAGLMKQQSRIEAAGRLRRRRLDGSDAKRPQALVQRSFD